MERLPTKTKPIKVKFILDNNIKNSVSNDTELLSFICKKCGNQFQSGIAEVVKDFLLARCPKCQYKNRIKDERQNVDGNSKLNNIRIYYLKKERRWEIFVKVSPNILRNASLEKRKTDYFADIYDTYLSDEMLKDDESQLSDILGEGNNINEQYPLTENISSIFSNIISVFKIQIKPEDIPTIIDVSSYDKMMVNLREWNNNLTSQMKNTLDTFDTTDSLKDEEIELPLIEKLTPTSPYFIYLCFGDLNSNNIVLHEFNTSTEKDMYMNGLEDALGYSKCYVCEAKVSKDKKKVRLYPEEFEP